MRAIHLFPTVTCLVLGGAASMGAQAPTADCEKAAKIIEQGHPPKEDYWAFAAVRRCGQRGAQAIAGGLATYASETNLTALRDFMRQVDDWRDASVFEAAMALAVNGAATPQARVFAVRHLLQLAQPTYVYTYEGLTRKADTTRTAELVVYTSACAAQIAPPMKDPAVGSPLPAGYDARIRSTLAALATSAATPEPVRNAARCLRTRT